ncbi:uncharacterized protein JCM15063_000772, partial [Sporobolomyces koalae]|uniref:uncharacterized protein n=1 Tax=Sporobolomyces koalae TaxID=500713 RepID=UPI003176C089
DGAIHLAAGPGLLKDCLELKGCDTGQTKMTDGHDLFAKFVAHTVGPIYLSKKSKDKERELRSCYQTVFKLCVDKDIKSVAFPGISTGVYGYPLDDAARVACDEVRKFCDSEDGDKIDHIIFCAFEAVNVASYIDNIPSYFPPAKPEAEPSVESRNQAEESMQEDASGDPRAGKDAAPDPNPKDLEGGGGASSSSGKKVPEGKASARKQGKQTHKASKKKRVT